MKCKAIYRATLSSHDKLNSESEQNTDSKKKQKLERKISLEMKKKKFFFSHRSTFVMV